MRGKCKNHKISLFSKAISASPLKGGSTPAPLTNPRGQIKMFETVGVLVVFFFLLIIGTYFYFNAQASALQTEKLQANEQHALQIVLKALHLPELDCSFLVTQRDNCIDAIKLDKLSTMLAENDALQERYFTTFGNARISIAEAYPGNASTTLYENQPAEYTGAIASHNPILLYHPWTNTYAFGVIEVTVYVQ